jgi:6-pyruvoyltetrahydropterin/6-carboxytetrahydropterin synthase
MIVVFKEFVLYCAHSLNIFGDEHKCARKHGHSYKIKIGVYGNTNPTTNIVIPFDEIESAWLKIGKPLDHTDLDDKFPTPTTECLAMYLQGQLNVELRRPVSVEVRETESSGVYIPASFDK